MSTSGKTILITGGSRGIGAATALAAADAGYNVVFSFCRNTSAAQRVCGEIEQRGGRALAIQGDVARERDIINLWSLALEGFGAIDGLVNNAGVLEKQSRLDEFSAERLQRIMQVNVIGAMLCAKEAVKHMSTKHGGRGGSIVNISSIAAKLTSPGEYIDYAASKSAVDTFTMGLAKEVGAEGVRVNAVRPGSIYTEIHASGGEPDRVDRVKQRVPMQRGGKACEIADAILWLLSTKASYVTGALIDVTGGI